MARWFKGKDGGKAPPGAQIIQMALLLHKLPEEIEQMDVFWFNRMAIWMEAEAAGEKLK
jgi:hypothetical protein